MVKKGKKNKRKGASLDELFSDGKGGAEGWTTGPAAMLLDEEEGAAPPAAGLQQPVTKPKRGKGKRASQQQGGAADMDTGEAPVGAAAQQSKAAKAVSKVAGLGVVAHSMKRGDRTARQKKRKVQKLQKAIAKSEQAGVRVDSKHKKKQNKIGLKHMY